MFKFTLVNHIYSVPSGVHALICQELFQSVAIVFQRFGEFGRPFDFNAIFLQKSHVREYMNNSLKCRNNMILRVLKSSRGSINLPQPSDPKLITLSESKDTLQRLGCGYFVPLSRARGKLK